MLKITTGMFVAAFLLSTNAGAATSALPKPVCLSVDKGHSGALSARARAIVTDDGIYTFLAQSNSAPGHCRGSIVAVSDQVDGWIEFTWSDQSVFQTQFMAPEMFKVRYSRAAGLRRPSEVLAAFRDYAAAKGLKINWQTAHKETQGDGEVIEYRDNDPGTNGLVRLTYDKDRRFVSIALSMAP